MVESSAPWGGTLIGDAGPYDSDFWSYIWRCLFTKNRDIEGVFQDYGSELEITNPAGTTIRVGIGIAMVDGKFYYNTAVKDFNVVAPGAGSNYYTIVLQKNWVGVDAQTVRSAMLGPNAVAPPAITQVDGTIWEISLATVQITSLGVITITDTRAFRKDSSSYPLVGRQGLNDGNTYWNTHGVVDSVPSGNTIMQMGVRRVIVGAGDNSGSAVITYPIPFSTEPFIFGTARSILAFGVANYNLYCASFDLTGGVSATVWATRETGSAGAFTVDVNWIAIGPKA